MQINIYHLLVALLTVTAIIGSHGGIPEVAFADTVKCNDNGDNNCNNTVIVQNINIDNSCNIINENKDHSSHNENVNQLFCTHQYANIYGSLINAPVFNTILGDGSILQDPFAPIT
jgi:hypothetical protein